MLDHHRRGAGSPLLLLHGIGMRWEWWYPCLEALIARHDVVAVDFPGHGGSAPLPPGEDPTPARLARSVEELVAELGLDRPHVAGISMGGQVSLELARRGSVASATAISPGGLSRGWELRWSNATLRMTERLVARLAPHADEVSARPRARALLLGQMCVHGSRIPAAECAGHVRATAASDFRRTLSALNGHLLTEPFTPAMPVTIAWGSRDHLLFPWQADRAVALVHGARKVVLAGSGHIPTYDDPAATVRAILDTVARAERPASAVSGPAT
jgi:pimeloyl-ACP methyl ester carboxylesterase